MTGYAPGWQVRCTKCGKTRPAADVGVVRVGAWSRGKFTLGWCSACRWPRLLAVERTAGPQAGARAGSQP